MKLCRVVSANLINMKGFVEKFQEVNVDEAYIIPGPVISNFDEVAIYALKTKNEIKRQFQWMTFTISSLTIKDQISLSFPYLPPEFRFGSTKAVSEELRICSPSFASGARRPFRKS